MGIPRGSRARRDLPSGSHDRGLGGATRHPWGYEYRIKTIEDWPVRLTIRRTDDERVYEASATVGHFKDRGERGQELLDALDRSLHALGAQRGFEVPASETLRRGGP